MEIIKIILIVVTAIGAVGFLVTWAHAYQKVENIDKWSRQIAVLQPWWFLDSKLLSKEHEYIRFRALKFFVLYLVPLLVLWWLSAK